MFSCLKISSAFSTSSRFSLSQTRTWPVGPGDSYSPSTYLKPEGLLCLTTRHHLILTSLHNHKPSLRVSQHHFPFPTPKPLKISTCLRPTTARMFSRPGRSYRRSLLPYTMVKSSRVVFGGMLQRGPILQCCRFDAE